MIKAAAVRVLLVVMVALAASAGPAWAGPPQPALYLALGDSVAAGVGAQPPSQGYVSVLYDKLTAARSCGRGQAIGCRIDLTNLAIPGATTTSLIGDQLPGRADPAGA